MDSRLERLRADAAALVADATAAGAWSGPERSTALISLDLVLASLARARAHLLVAERDAGTSQRPGDRSFEAARARLSRSSSREATRQVQQADALVSMPAVADAVADGRMPLGHLDTLARVAATASPQVASVLRSADVQATVVRMAAGQSEPDFGKTLARFVAAKDPAALEAAHQDARRERFLTLSHQSRGTYLKGFLDRVSAEALQTALDSTGQIPTRTAPPARPPRTLCCWWSTARAPDCHRGRGARWALGVGWVVRRDPPGTVSRRSPSSTTPTTSRPAPPLARTCR